jgi:hypothetical protein
VTICHKAVARLRTMNVFPQANLMAPATPANCDGTAVIRPVGPKAAEAFDGHHDTHTCNLPPITQQYLPTTSPRMRTTDGTAVSLYTHASPLPSYGYVSSPRHQISTANDNLSPPYHPFLLDNDVAPASHYVHAQQTMSPHHHTHPPKPLTVAQ